MLFAVTYPVQRLFDLQLALADAETETEVVSKRSEHLRIDVERLEEKQGVSSDEWSEANRASRALEMDTIKLIGARRKLQFQNYQTWCLFRNLSGLRSVASTHVDGGGGEENAVGAAVRGGTWGGDAVVRARGAFRR